MKKHRLFESEQEAGQTVPKHSITRIKIDNRIYGLAHTSRGFKVFNRACPHAGADLSAGKINYLGELVCPLHAYAFNFLDGEEDRRRCPSMTLYETLWEEGKLYVLMPPSVNPAIN